MITITAAPIPTDFRGTPQELLNAFLDRVEITSDTVGFVVTDEQPTANDGVWLKNGTQIWVWDEDTSTYVPLDVSASTSDEIHVGATAPDEAEFQIWLKVVSSAVVGLFYYMGTELGWVAQEVGVADGSITTAKLGDLSVTTNKIANGAVTAVKLGDNIPMSKWEIGDPRAFLRMNAAGTAADWETPFSVTTEQVVAINSIVEVAHLLDATPHSVECVMVLKEADGSSWEVGDEVKIEMFRWDSGGADDEITYSSFKNETTVGCVFRGNIFVWDRATSGNYQIDPLNWRVKFYITSS
jgi:hypothetical protein